MKRIVLFMYRGPQFPTQEFLSGREIFFPKLTERDIDVRIVMTSDAPFTPSGIITRRLVSEKVFSEDTEIVPYAAVGMIINRSGRRVVPTVEVLLENASIAVMNRNQLRTMLRDKDSVQRIILDTAGAGMPTARLTEPDDATTFMKDNPAREYIVKPNNGAFGMFVDVVKRLKPEEVEVYAHENLGTPLIMQPAYTFTHKFPDYIKPYDEAAVALFNEYNQSGIVKEIRVYGFYAAGKTWTFPIARVLTDKSYWFFIDPAGVPESVITSATKILETIAEKTDSQVLLVSIDFGYGGIDNGPLDYHVIEVNGQAPFIIGYDMSYGAADAVRTMLVEVIDTIVSQPVVPHTAD